jgi:hypothetical protein
MTRKKKCAVRCLMKEVKQKKKIGKKKKIKRKIRRREYSEYAN